MAEKININFFKNSADKVARELLGKILVRRVNENGKKREIRGKIVETEAYFDSRDPASRACQNGDLKKTMGMDYGTLLVYGVHNSWLVNIVTGEKGKHEAVLIRAVEPLNFSADCSGPGKLTRALDINKSFHKKKLGKEILIEEGDKIKEIAETKRIGVKKDLNKNFRFYIKDNKYVSKK